MQQSHSNTTPKIIGFLVILAVTATGAYFFLFRTLDTDAVSSESAPAATVVSTTAQASSTPTSTETVQSDTASPATGYTAGTYSASANYSVPHGNNTIAVEATIAADGTISAVSSEHSYGDPESRWYFDAFDSAVSGEVVGKNISTVNPSRLGGASLTTNAFDQALSNILDQAQA